MPASYRGSLNMALDEALMQVASGRISNEIPLRPGQRAEDQVSDSSSNPPPDLTIRIYLWESPTLSLGYFQKHEDRYLHPSSNGCEFVRRNSGGGAILHDRELTYSLTVHEDAIDSNSSWLYESTHRSIVAALARFGVQAEINEKLDRTRESEFLCFARRAPNDVLVGNYKVCGSAQRKKHGIIGQHGSIILNTSPFAPEIPGINDIADKTIDVEQFCEAWIPELESNLGRQAEVGGLTSRESRLAKLIEDVKFSTIKWNRRR